MCDVIFEAAEESTRFGLRVQGGSPVTGVTVSLSASGVRRGHRVLGEKQTAALRDELILYTLGSEMAERVKVVAEDDDGAALRDVLIRHTLCDEAAERVMAVIAGDAGDAGSEIAELRARNDELVASNVELVNRLAQRDKAPPLQGLLAENEVRDALCARVSETTCRAAWRVAMERDRALSRAFEIADAVRTALADPDQFNHRTRLITRLQAENAELKNAIQGDAVDAGGGDAS